MRSKRVFKNVFWGLIYELVTVICGLILPRIILLNFGSEYNGITSSITQFLSVIALLKAGLGGVTRAALYKPLAEKDDVQISKIILSTESFMRKIALFFLVFLIVFSALYPFIAQTTFDWLFTASLVIIIGISTFVQYYYGITFQMLLMADQKEYIIYYVQIFTTILNTVLAAFLVYLFPSIHVVKLGSAIAFCINPLIINRYCYRHYKIDRSVGRDNSLISQRWDALGQEVAQFVNNNTDVMVITVAIGVNEVSVYTVYNAVIAGLRRFLSVFFQGFGAAFGNMYAKSESSLMEKNLRAYEVVLFSLSSILFSTTLVMFLPYVSLYTHGVTDVNYLRPLFALLMVITGIIDSLKMPYESIILAAGRFKETKKAAFIEATVNIVISIALTFEFGIVGVAIGTIVAYLFRATWDAYFLSKYLIPRKLSYYFFNILSIISSLVPTYYISKTYIALWNNSILGWAECAVITLIIATAIRGLIDVLFYKEESVLIVKKVISFLPGGKKD